AFVAVGEPDAAAVLVEDGAGEVEADTEAGGATGAVVGAVEAGKDAVALFFRERGPAVADGGDAIAVLEPGADLDGGVFGSVFGGVVEQVDEHLAQTDGIGGDRKRGWKLYLYMPLGMQDPNILGDRLYQLGIVEAHRVHLEAAGLHTREIEEL